VTQKPIDVDSSVTGSIATLSRKDRRKGQTSTVNYRHEFLHTQRCREIFEYLRENWSFG
jgi:hypothetical protein